MVLLVKYLLNCKHSFLNSSTTGGFSKFKKQKQKIMPNLARLPITGSDANTWSDILNRQITQTTSPLNGAFNSFDQFSARPTNLTADDAGQTYLYTQTGNWHEWSGTEWKVQNKSEINVKDYGVVGDGVVDDTVAIQSCILLLTNNQVKKMIFPTALYKCNIIISLGVDDEKEFIIDGEGSTIIGELKVYGCKHLILQNFANISLGLHIAGLWSSKINNIRMSGSFRITSGWQGGPNYWGTYWNVFENIKCAGVIVNSQAFVANTPGINNNQFISVVSFNALSNNTNNWDDTKKSGLRVVGDVQNLTFTNSDFSYNDYGIYNESKSNVQLIGCYLEGINVKGFFGGVNMIYSELSDDGTKNINFNYDGKSQLFMSDSASTRVGSLLQTGSSVFFNSDLKYIDKNGRPLGFIDGSINPLQLQLVNDTTGSNPFGKVLKISNPFTDRRSAAIPFNSPTNGYISWTLNAKGDIPINAFVTNYTTRTASDFHYGILAGESSNTEYRLLVGKLGGNTSISKGMKCAVEIYLDPGQVFYIDRIFISPGQVASLTSPVEYKQTGYDTTFPTLATTSWNKGDIFYNTNPAPSSFVGWICTTAGTPGTWKGFGLIQA